MPLHRLAALAASLLSALPVAALTPEQEAVFAEALRGGSNNLVFVRGTTPATFAEWKQSFLKLEVLVGWVHASSGDQGRAAEGMTLVELRTSPDPADGPDVLRKMVTREPPSGTNTIIVAPAAVIAGAFGPEEAALREGDAIVYHVEGRGRYRKLGRLAKEELAAMAERRRVK